MRDEQELEERLREQVRGWRLACCARVLLSNTPRAAALALWRALPACSGHLTNPEMPAPARAPLLTGGGAGAGAGDFWPALAAGGGRPERAVGTHGCPVCRGTLDLAAHAFLEARSGLLVEEFNMAAEQALAPAEQCPAPSQANSHCQTKLPLTLVRRCMPPRCR